MWCTCRPMILGSYTVGRSSRIRVGTRSPGFFGAASDCRSELDLESDTSEDSAGAGGTGGTTGTATEHSSTTTPLSRTVETSATKVSITVISLTATLATAWT